jgi:hypothetical protein
MKTERLKIHLIPAPDEAPIESAQYQKELRKLEKSLRSQGVSPSFGLNHIYAAAGEGAAIYSGAFMVAAVGSVVGRCVVEWINGHFGRKVSLEVWPDGRVKGEAKNAKEVEKLFKTAEEHQKKAAKKSPKKKGKKTAKKGHS